MKKVKAVQVKKREKIIVTSVALDPLTADDINYLQKCKEKGDWLIVGILSDQWLHQFRGGFIQNYDERLEIARSLKMIDEIFTFNDIDGTVRNLLRKIKIAYANADIVYVSEEDMKDTAEAKIPGIIFEIMKED